MTDRWLLLNCCMCTEMHILVKSWWDFYVYSHSCVNVNRHCKIIWFLSNYWIFAWVLAVQMNSSGSAALCCIISHKTLLRRNLITWKVEVFNLRKKKLLVWVLDIEIGIKYHEKTLVLVVLKLYYYYIILWAFLMPVIVFQKLPQLVLLN